MAIRVRCKCGKSLKISSKHADKKIACPACKHPFRIPAAKFEAAARKAQASGAAHKSAAGSAAAAPAAGTATASAADPLPASLDDELSALGSGLLEHSHSDVLYDLAGDSHKAPSEAAPVAIALEDKPVEVGYAPDRPAMPTTRRLADPVSGPVRGFWADAGLSLIYPVKGAGNVITLAIIFFVSAVGDLAVDFGALGFVCMLIIGGWFASVYLSVIQDTAAGSEDLPGFNLEGGWIEGIIFPAIKFVGAIALVFAPAILFGIAAILGWTPPGMNSLIPVWYLGGVFLMPISLLLFALGSPATMLRIDQIMVTIAKSILPYLAVWAILAIVGTIILIARVGGEIVGLLLPSTLLSDSLAPLMAGLIGRIILSWVGVYFMIVGMRIIGLYYLHFKKRFVFIME